MELSVANTLRDVANQLLQLADGGELPIAFPPGMIAVKPTGVLGQGKTRYWPQPIEVQRIDGTRGMELCWSYALRLSCVARPDGEMYVPKIFQQGIGEWMIKVAPPPEQSHLYPATVDRWLYPEDWYSQRELDARVLGDSQWAAQHYAAEAAKSAYPRVVEIEGVKFEIKAEVNPCWRPSAAAKIFGRGVVLPDPSNAPEGRPKRSPAGYPLHYYDHVREPVIPIDDLTFSTDAEVVAYLNAAAASAAGQAQRDAETGADFSGGKPPAGETEVEIGQE